MAKSARPMGVDEERGAGGGPTALLVVTGSYFATLVGVRVLTTVTHSRPGAGIDLWGTHLHHFEFVMIAILVVGMLALDELWPVGRAVLFGIGAALVLDEVALAVGLVALVVNAWRSRTLIRIVIGRDRG